MRCDNVHAVPRAHREKDASSPVWAGNSPAFNSKGCQRQDTVRAWQRVLDRVALGIQRDPYQPVTSADNQSLCTCGLMACQRMGETAQRNNKRQDNSKAYAGQRHHAHVLASFLRGA